MQNDRIQDLAIKKNETILSCLKKLNKTNKQFLYVKNSKNALIGIVTDADIRRALLKKKKINDTILSIYNRKPKYVFENDNFQTINKVFNQTKVNVLIVVNTEFKVVDYIDVHSFGEKKKLKETIVIMAGGKGLRLRPLTKNIPKPLIKIQGNKSILEYSIDRIINQGFKKIYLITNYLSDKIKNKINSKIKYRKIVRVLKEDTFMGTVGGISLLKTKRVKFPIILINGDIISDIDIEALKNYHIYNNNDLTVVLKTMSTKSNFGEVSISNLKVKNIEEKKIKTTFINAGIYCLGSSVFNFINSKGKKLDRDTLLKDLIKKKFKVGAYPILEFWMDIGNKTNLEKIRNIMKKK